MRVKFICQPLYTQFKCGDAGAKDILEVIQVVRHATSARPEGYRYMPRYRAGTWDGYIQLLKGEKFPTGLLGLVVDSLRDIGISSIEIVHYNTPDRDPHSVVPHLFEDITLRPYQVKAARTMLSYGRGVANMATNAGKTLVFASMIKQVSCSALVLTTDLDLLYQTSSRLSIRLNEDIGLIGDGHWELNRVTVGTIQTLSRHLDRAKSDFNNLGMIVFDECHHIPSKTSQAVMYNVPAPLRYGFSGTPLSNDRLTDLILIGATGPVLVEVSNAQLIYQGISAEPHVMMLVVTDGSMYDLKWSDAYDELIVHNDVRNSRLVDAVMGYGATSTLILVERLEHGVLLERMIDGSKFVNGGSEADERQAALDSLREGEGAVVISTPIFDEGVDVPAVSMLVLAGGGKSPRKLLQRLGRGMRRKENDNVLHVLDFVDDTNEYLLRHSLQRAEVYEEEGFSVEIVE